jgi:peptidylprolyl isomerase
MVRLCLAVFTAVFLAACQPSATINAEDPYQSLYPWKPDLKGVQTTDNGVQYIVIRKGDGKGEFPTAMDEVEVHYDGRLASSGEQFDASYGGDPARFRLNQVIPGWTEGLQKMQPGDEFMFFIPAKMGYGERGAGGRIPPNADLMFRVELLAVHKARVSDPEAWKKASPWPADSSDVVRTSSGLEYMIIRSGDADQASPSDRDYALVHFEGRLDDGTVFASTFEMQDPQIFPIAQLTDGWAEALKLMRPGDRWMLRLPAHLMYGADGDGIIPPGASVTFEVELDQVISIPDEPPAAAPAKP